MRSGADQLGMPDQEGENVRRLKSLLADYEAAATADLDIEQTRSATLQVFAEYYAEEFSWIEAPTPFYPQGRSGGRLALSHACGRRSLSSQRRSSRRSSSRARPYWMEPTPEAEEAVLAIVRRPSCSM